ncbi:MAG TPA: hypothetical protein VF939_26070 [Puia sp.]
MAQKEHTKFTGVQLKGIELLNSSINLPDLPEIALANFIFTIKIESKIDAAAKLIFVVVAVDIKIEEDDIVVGTLAVSCIYSISNFDEVVKRNAEGKFEIPPSLVDLLNSVSVSTTRGVMFSTFKGTFLHTAFLPMIEPRQFQVF